MFQARISRYAVITDYAVEDSSINFTVFSAFSLANDVVSDPVTIIPSQHRERFIEFGGLPWV